MKPNKSRWQHRPLHLNHRFRSALGCAACIGAVLFAAKGFSYQSDVANAAPPGTSVRSAPAAGAPAAGVPAAGVPANSESMANDVRAGDHSPAVNMVSAGAPDAEQVINPGGGDPGREGHQIDGAGTIGPAMKREGIASESASGDSRSAQAPPPVAVASDELAHIQSSVRQLMLLETHHALMRSRGGASSGPISSLRPESLSGAVREGPQLRAIYGVGQRLLAEVAMGADTLVFMKGHPVPMGYKPGAAPYRLAGWDKHCIRLEPVMRPQLKSRVPGSLRAERVDLELTQDSRAALPRDDAPSQILSLCLRAQAGEG